MDHIGIIKNALQTTIRYRALWILGFLWALTGGGMSGRGAGNAPSGTGSGSEYRMDMLDLEKMGIDPGRFAAFSVALLSWIILACSFLFLLAILITIIRYVIQAGVYRSLAQLEYQGVTPTVRGAFREGWHRRTWRMFFQNLLMFIAAFVVLILLALLVAVPVVLLSNGGEIVSALGIGFTILFGLCWILLLAVVIIVIGVLSQFWWRAAIIGDQDTFTAMRSAWRLVRSNPTDVLIMWLLMLGIGILFALAMLPVLLLVGLITAVVAGGPGYIIYQATESIGWALAWGIPVGLIVFVIPLTFVSGLYLIFHSSVWNQVYNALVERTGLVAS